MSPKRKQEILSLIQEIINENEQINVPLSALLLKAKRIFIELHNPKFEGFIKSELEGYNDETKVPNYRIVPSVPVGIFQHRYTGAINEVQLNLEELFKSVDMDPNSAYQRFIPHAIPFMEHFEKENPTGQIAVEFIPQQLNTLKNVINENNGWFLKSGYFKLASGTFIQIITTVRGLLLDHLLNLKIELTKTNKLDKSKFFQNTKNFDAALAITEIIKTAKNEIILIDGYIDEQTLKFFSIGEPIKSIKILTNAKSLNNQLQILISAFNKQYKNLEVQTSNAFHDRFIIIDRTSFYHVGASIKDAGQHAFMYSKIEGKFLKDEIIKKFELEWK